jgi:hypothetical protein
MNVEMFSVVTTISHEQAKAKASNSIVATGREREKKSTKSPHDHGCKKTHTNNVTEDGDKKSELYI